MSIHTHTQTFHADFALDFLFHAIVRAHTEKPQTHTQCLYTNTHTIRILSLSLSHTHTHTHTSDADFALGFLLHALV
jgi:hypothetical protein